MSRRQRRTRARLSARHDETRLRLSALAHRYAALWRGMRWESARAWLRERAPVLAVFALACAVRLVFNVTVAAHYDPTFDAAIYNGLAKSLVRQHCYCYPPYHPTAFRPPLWPFVIAAIYAVVGIHSDIVRLFCCLLGAGTCVLLYHFAKDLFGARVALVTGLLAAVYAGMFIWDGWLYAESLYIFLQMVFLLAMSHMQRDPRRVWIVVCGVALGLAALTRPNGVVLLALLCLWAGMLIAFRLAPARRILISVVVVALLALAITLPWTFRSATVTHSLAPVSTIGTTLAGAYNDMTARPGDVLYGLWWLPLSLNADFHEHTARDEQALTQRAMTWISAHPAQTRALLWVHVQHMWTPYRKAFDGHPFDQFPNRSSTILVRDVLLPVMSYTVFLLAALGLVATARRRWAQLLPVYLTIALTIAQNVVFYGTPRFRAPIEPLLVLLVGGLLWTIFSNDGKPVFTLQVRRALLALAWRLRLASSDVTAGG